MAATTNIEWTDATWNPITGCSVTSTGCRNCYAMTLAGGRLKTHPSRRGLTQASKTGPVWTGEVRRNSEWMNQPSRWHTGRMIFTCAHGDLFHPKVPDEWIDAVFDVIHANPQHIFQVLTKQAGRAADYLLQRSQDDLLRPRLAWNWPIKNVWLGISAENDKWFRIRTAQIKPVPATVKWISVEPYIDEIDLGLVENMFYAREIDWMVVGGESGKRARAMHPDWVRAIVQAGQQYAVPIFFKQWGEWAPAEAIKDPDNIDFKHIWHQEMDGDGAWQDTPGDYESIEENDGRQTPDTSPGVVHKVGKKNTIPIIDGERIMQFPLAVEHLKGSKK